VDTSTTLLLGSLESPQWHRVAGLRPHLRTHVRVQRRRSGDEVWYLLIDPDTGRFHRLNRPAYEWVGRLDGQHDVDSLWRHVHARLGEAAPTQAEVMRLLAQLSEAELVTVDALPELELLLRHRRRKELRRKLAVANPLSFKVPLFDPSAVLNTLLPLVRPVFSGWGLLAWLALIMAGVASAVSHAPTLAQALKAQGTSTGFLLTVWLAYPCVKLLHEFGHAFAVRVWGGEVREMGINLMLLTPVPYVDASSATQFAQRHRRMLVGAAGIMVELAIAALALFAWLATGAPGLQQLALAVMTLCTLSTLLFNGNPLARFDGYYVLSDALETPNLGARADAVLRRWTLRALGLRWGSDSESPGAQAWLGSYAVLAVVYRWVVGLAVVHWLHEEHPLLALAVALLLGVGMVARPLWAGLRRLLWDARLNGRRARALTRAAVAAAGLLAALAWIPAPSMTVQDGVVWLPEQAILRTGTDGSLHTLHAEAGAHVNVGDPIATLENLELVGEREAAAARLAQIDVEYFHALGDEPVRAQALAAQRGALNEQIERLDRRLASLQVRAQASGTLVLPRERTHEGHFFPQGRELGYVLVDEPMLVKVALTEAQAALVQAHTEAVTVRLAQAPQEALAARIERRTPGATQVLPSAALGSAQGGPIATDPRDPQGRKTLQPVSVLDVRVPGRSAEHMGMRAWVRFEHAREPLARQWLRALRQLFLRSLGAHD
jgi:putative peptide zinc metalloprotease protein